MWTPPPDPETAMPAELVGEVVLPLLFKPALWITSPFAVGFRTQMPARRVVYPAIESPAYWMLRPTTVSGADSRPNSRPTQLPVTGVVEVNTAPFARPVDSVLSRPCREPAESPITSPD